MTGIGRIAAAAARRPPQQLAVGFDDKPFDVFVLRIAGTHFVGRKSAARLDDGPLRKCCLIEPAMLLGHLSGLRTEADGYRIYHRPLVDDEPDHVFAALTATDDLTYPLARLAGPDRRETAQPPDYWVPTGDLAERLDRDEAVLRAHAMGVLDRLDLAAGIAYDPACSTGTFLAALKRHRPGLYTVGQDRSPGMIELARRHLDLVEVGDSRMPIIAPGTADLVVCRHLNLDVVVSQTAEALFRKAATTLRSGGYMFLTGHTPLLLASEWLELNGFRIVEAVGTLPARAAAFQFYVLTR